MSTQEPKRRGRPRGIASIVAEETGISLRTVQRVLAADAKKPETEIEMRTRRTIEAFRNFASYCRDNPPALVGQLAITDDQAEKLGQWRQEIDEWFRAMHPESDDPPPG